MANSYVTHTGTGSQLTFSFAGIDDYLSTGYIKVYLNNVLQTTNYSLDVSGGNENVVFTAGNAPAASVIVRIQRETPSTSSGFTSEIVDFANGSVLTADDLDKGFKGMLHIVQEANDTGSGALPKNSAGTNWDAETLKITNGAMGVDPGDFVTKAQLDAAQVYGTAITVPQSWAFTGVAAQTAFTFSPTALATNPAMFIVEVGGVIQRPTTDYTLTASVLTFLTAPSAGVSITVRNFGVARSALDALPNGAVTETYLADGAVTTAKIATNAVTSDKLADNAVDAASIIDGAVTAGKLGTNAVVTANITDLNVTEGKLAVGAVTSAKLGSLAVTNASLGTGVITSDKIASNTIVYNNLNASTSGSFFGPALAGVDRYLKVAASGALSLDALTNVPVGSTATGNVNMNAYKFTNVGAAAAGGEVLTYGQVEQVSGDLAGGYYLMTAKSTRRWLAFGTFTFTFNTGVWAVNDTGPSTTIQGIASNPVLRPIGAGTWAILAVWSQNATGTTYSFAYQAGLTSSSSTGWLTGSTFSSCTGYFIAQRTG
jgi:hypothetical protein